jgi:hypothetical protein
MNRKILFLATATAIVLATGWNVSRNMNGKAPVSDMALANVEAPAQGEVVGFTCEFMYVSVCHRFSDGSFAPGKYVGDIIAY